MHVWRDVLWSSFTDELTKIAMANAAARTVRMPSPRPQASMLKNINPTNAHPPVGFNSAYSTKPNMVPPREFAPIEGATMTAPSMQVTGAGPVAQTGMIPRIPQNMPNPLTQVRQGMPPPMMQSGPMNMMNTRGY